MEILAFALLWPFLFFLVGFVFISGYDISGFFILPLAFVFLIIVLGLKERLGNDHVIAGEREDLEQLRRGIIAFSIAILLPMFIKYLLAVSGNDLQTMVICLALGFGAIIWGLFIKNNKVLSYANTMGGALIIVYLYSQLWALGQLAQIIAAAFGLAVAVIVSAIKFRSKLT